MLKKFINYKILLIISLVFPSSFFIADYFFPLPLQHVKITQMVVAEDGSPLWRFADNEGVWRYPVALKDVSPDYIDALLLYEDRWFYQHWGINPLSILRAIGQYITNGKIVSGGSTLSMQVARLIDPHERNLFGKLKQIFRTLQLELHYSKDEILTLYLNRAPYGGTLQGIGAASWVYLGKPPSDLTKSEAALLAVLPQAPSRLRPDRYPERAQVARNKVLDRLATFGVWTQQEVDEIRQEDIWLAPRQLPQLAPLLARRLIANSNEHLIKTTIDIDLQRKAEDIALNWKNILPANTSLGILIVDHTDMKAKAYVGSIDFNDANRFGHVDMISAWRSPGSTLKPLLHAMAMDEGLIHSESLLQDIPRLTSDYRPGNFSSGFHGPISAAESLIRSLNLPSVQLIEAYGPKKFAANLRNVGTILRFPPNAEPNLSLILGGTAVRMDQLMTAYSAFARGGKSAAIRFTPDQPIIEKRLMSQGSAWIIRRILAGDGRPSADGYVSDIVPLAWKTGTSYGYRDAWAVGLNARYLIGVWIGRPDGTPVAGQFGNATAVPLLTQIDMMLLNRERQLARILPRDPQPYSVSSSVICWPIGQPLPLDDENCHQHRRAWIVDNTIPVTLQQKDPIGRQSGWMTIWTNKAGLRVAPDCEGAIEKKIALWPPLLESWLQPSEKRFSRIPKVDPSCPLIGEDSYSQLAIIGISNNDQLMPLPGESTLTLQLNTQGGHGKRWWFLNGDLIAELGQGQRLIKALSQKGKYQLVVLDETGQIDRIAFTLE